MAARSEPTTKPARAELAITRVLDAPRELVFAAWTDPARLAQWFGPEGFTAAVHHMDARPGGTYRFCMHAPDGGEHWVHGTYREIVAPERLVFTWIRENSDGIGVETVVTVTLLADGERTTLTLHHALFDSVAVRDSHQGGWSSCLDHRLTRYLATA